VLVFNLGIATAKRVVNHFWRGREQIFYVHSCITFALFVFKWGPWVIEGCYNGSGVQKKLKTIIASAMRTLIHTLWDRSVWFFAEKGFLSIEKICLIHEKRNHEVVKRCTAVCDCRAFWSAGAASTIA